MQALVLGLRGDARSRCLPSKNQEPDTSIVIGPATSVRAVRMPSRRESREL